MANATFYRVIYVALPAPPASGDSGPIAVVPAGQPVIAVTALTLPAAAINPAGVGYLSLIIGESNDRLRLNQQGVTWYAQRGRDNIPVPNVAGVYIAAGDDLAGAYPAGLFVELYVELLSVS
ncbi:MAG TPA: hypothetical protein VI231_22245 [Candidatus Binatia bacterium]|jgi:hypothetical protein